MRDNGFNVEIRLDVNTGLLHGGNKDNCGTWMDKMGSSDKTGNKGIPATPRDGVPIELVAMQYSVLRFMEELYTDRVINSNIVCLPNGTEWTYGQWADLIKENFETLFWVPEDPEDDVNYSINPRQVNRRGIYKDVFHPTEACTEYQLRPNLCVAMTFAEDLFDASHARHCLGVVENVLMEPGCLGIKTLDPSDRNYKGDYNNADDSCGWNYHQGPEWLWPVGFFL